MHEIWYQIPKMHGDKTNGDVDLGLQGQLLQASCGHSDTSSSAFQIQFPAPAATLLYA